MSVSVVLKNATKGIGEGPHWDPLTQSLYYVDITEGNVHRWDSKIGEDTKVHFGGTIGFIVPCKSGGYLIGKDKTVSRIDWGSSGQCQVLATVDEGKTSRFNDAKCDRSGRLWCGTMGIEERFGSYEKTQGSLYSFGNNQKVTKHLTDIEISNGLAWSLDDKTMYYIDSIPRKVYAFDFDINSGSLNNQRVAVDFNQESMEEIGVPDGMCSDNDGNLWIACFNASKVVKCDPNSGKILQKIDFPARRITSCCFGGENFDELYVTSACWHATENELKQYPLSGSLFKVTGLGVKGSAPNIYEN